VFDHRITVILGLYGVVVLTVLARGRRRAATVSHPRVTVSA
jgi:hypothetical protein